MVHPENGYLSIKGFDSHRERLRLRGRFPTYFR
jgi:hypothetical protein